VIGGCIPQGQGSTPPLKLKQVFSCLRLSSLPTGGVLLLLVFSLCCVFAASCASSSRSAEKDEPIENQLPPGAALYGFANIRHMGNLIENLLPEQLNNKQTKSFIEKTDLAVLGLYRIAANGQNPSAESFYLITEGNYPVSAYNFGFTLSSKWKSAVIDGKKWWQQGATALSIEKKRAYIRLGAIPPESSGSPATMDEEFGALFGNARRSFNAESGEPPVIFASFIYSSETAGFIRRMGIPLNITLAGITLAVTTAVTAEEKDSCRSTLRIITKSPSEAKGLLAILSLVRTQIGSRADNAFISELIFANPPVLDGNTIAVTGTFPLEVLVSSIKHLGLFPGSPQEQ
jgi:hypothetical protein